MTRTMKPFAVTLLSALTLTSVYGNAQDKPLSGVLITNARIFDGKSTQLTGPMSVLVEGNKITKIAASITAPSGANVIDAGGRTLSPGFVDAHANIMWQLSFSERNRSDEYFQCCKAWRWPSSTCRVATPRSAISAATAFRSRWRFDRGMSMDRASTRRGRSSHRARA
ncbi:MAG: amidohydrolase family protein, partial [Steroidobacteraceae bacterium]